LDSLFRREIELHMPDRNIKIHRVWLLISRRSTWIASDYVLLRLIKCNDAGTYSLVDRDGYVGTLTKLPEVFRGNCPVEKCVCGDRKSVYCKEAVVLSNFCTNGTMEKTESSGINWFNYIPKGKKRRFKKGFRKKPKHTANRKKKLNLGYRKSAPR